MSAQAVDIGDKPPNEGKVQQRDLPRVLLPDLLTAHEVAAALRVHPNTLRAWRHENYGPAVVMVGRYPRYTRGAVAAWVKKQTSGGTQ